MRFAPAVMADRVQAATAALAEEVVDPVDAEGLLEQPARARAPTATATKSPLRTSSMTAPPVRSPLRAEIYSPPVWVDHCSGTLCRSNKVGAP